MCEPEELFRSTAAYYARYRSGYPDGFFTYLRESQNLDGTQAVLDLGCGTGQMAVPLACDVGRVFAVDPQPDMLEWGERRAADVGVENIEWMLGDSTQLLQFALPPLALVTMGASFHWMDRDRVLEDLDQLVEDDGCVVVASGRASGEAEVPTWAEIVREVRERYLGAERRAGSRTDSHPADRHEVVLDRSSFSDFASKYWNWGITRSVEDVIGLQLSFSFSTPALLGDRLNAYQAELGDALHTAYCEGRITEKIETEALLACRP